MIDAIDSVVLNFPRQFGFCEKLKKIARFLRWFKGEEERRERVDERISKILTGESIGKRDPLFFFFCNIPPLAFRFISKAVFPRARSLKSETILRNNFETFQRDLVPWPRRNET